MMSNKLENIFFKLFLDRHQSKNAADNIQKEIEIINYLGFETGIKMWIY